jgi:hypothetical protein
MYHRRKVTWDKTDELIPGAPGHMAQVAINRVYQVYDAGYYVADIINQMG